MFLGDIDVFTVGINSRGFRIITAGVTQVAWSDSQGEFHHTRGKGGNRVEEDEESCRNLTFLNFRLAKTLISRYWVAIISQKGRRNNSSEV